MPATVVTVPTLTQNSPFLPQRWVAKLSPVLITPIHGGMVRLSGMGNTRMVDPPKVVTNLSTNRTQRSLTWFM